MPCYSPLTAYRSKVIGETGLRGITFSRGASFSGVPMQLPCGKCIGCKLEYSRQWAMRCVHELKFHSTSAFLTLTYKPEKLPMGGTLVKSDLSAFIKRLHNRLLYRRGYGVRFYACGEYGERLSRPHYHAIIFGYDFPDKYKIGSKGGDPLFASDECSELWPDGFNSIGEVTFNSCAYVARYVTKKITGEGADAHYQGLEPEFCNMSRRPGIGSQYVSKYMDEIKAHDSVIINGREVAIPRFYDGKIKALDAARLEVLKKARQRKAFAARADNTPARRRVREKSAILKLRAKARSL